MESTPRLSHYNGEITANSSKNESVDRAANVNSESAPMHSAAAGESHSDSAIGSRRRSSRTLTTPNDEGIETPIKLERRRKRDRSSKRIEEFGDSPRKNGRLLNGCNYEGCEKYKQSNCDGYCRNHNNLVMMGEQYGTSKTRSCGQVISSEKTKFSSCQKWKGEILTHKGKQIDFGEKVVESNGWTNSGSLCRDFQGDAESREMNNEKIFEVAPKRPPALDSSIEHKDEAKIVENTTTILDWELRDKIDEITILDTESKILVVDSNIIKNKSFQKENDVAGSDPYHLKRDTLNLIGSSIDEYYGAVGSPEITMDEKINDERAKRPQLAVDSCNENKDEAFIDENMATIQNDKTGTDLHGRQKGCFTRKNKRCERINQMGSSSPEHHDDVESWETTNYGMIDDNGPKRIQPEVDYSFEHNNDIENTAITLNMESTTHPVDFNDVKRNSSINDYDEAGTNLDVRTKDHITLKLGGCGASNNMGSSSPVCREHVENQGSTGGRIAEKESNLRVVNSSNEHEDADAIDENVLTSLDTEPMISVVESNNDLNKKISKKKNDEAYINLDDRPKNHLSCKYEGCDNLYRTDYNGFCWKHFRVTTANYDSVEAACIQRPPKLDQSPQDAGCVTRENPSHRSNQDTASSFKSRYLSMTQSEDSKCPNAFDSSSSRGQGRAYTLSSKTEQFCDQGRGELSNRTGFKKVDVRTPEKNLFKFIGCNEDSRWKSDGFCRRRIRDWDLNHAYASPSCLYEDNLESARGSEGLKRSNPGVAILKVNEKSGSSLVSPTKIELKIGLSNGEKCKVDSCEMFSRKNELCDIHNRFLAEDSARFRRQEKIYTPDASSATKSKVYPSKVCFDIELAVRPTFKENFVSGCGCGPGSAKGDSRSDTHKSDLPRIDSIESSELLLISTTKTNLARDRKKCKVDFCDKYSHINEFCFKHNSFGTDLLDCSPQAVSASHVSSSKLLTISPTKVKMAHGYRCKVATCTKYRQVNGFCMRHNTLSKKDTRLNAHHAKKFKHSKSGVFEEGDIVIVKSGDLPSRIITVHPAVPGLKKKYDIANIFGGRQDGVDKKSLSAYSLNKFFIAHVNVANSIVDDVSNTHDQTISVVSSPSETAMLERTRCELLNGNDMWICTTCAVAVSSLEMPCGVCRRLPSFVPLDMKEFEEFVKVQRRKQNHRWVYKEADDSRCLVLNPPDVMSYVCKNPGCVQPGQLSYDGHCESHFSNMVDLDQRVVVQDEDRSLVNEFTFLVFQQMELCYLSEDDKRGRYRDRNVGDPGLVCKHCRGLHKGRTFPTYEASLYSTQCTKHLAKHIESCEKVPAETKKLLAIMATAHEAENGSTEQSKKPLGGKVKFFRRIWSRLNATKATCRFQDCNAEARCDGLCKTHLSASRLFLYADRRYISDYITLVFEQMQPCFLVEADKKNGLHEGQEIGFPGIACRHCVDQFDGGRYFSMSDSSMYETVTVDVIATHLRNCSGCPEKIKQKLASVEESKEGPCKETKCDGLKDFYHKIWCLINKAPQSTDKM